MMLTTVKNCGQHFFVTKLPENTYIIKNGENMNRVKKLIHLEYAYHRLGLTGENITVGVMDTGIVKHADFGQRIIGFKDFCNRKISLYDDNGHGTHVAGIVAGAGTNSRHSGMDYSGVAPASNLLVLKVLEQNGNGNTKSVLQGMDWLIKNKDKYQVRLLNISVGMLKNAGEKEKRALLDAVDAAWDAGIMVVTAAGNNGPKENTVTIPGISRKVLTVGSVDDGSNKTGNSLKEGYSGRGPTDSCIMKPEILAPGTNVTSCSRDGKGYIRKSGTSMAAPVVTGTLALAFQHFPELSPAEMKLRLYESAYPRGEYFHKKAWGMIHGDNLLRYHSIS